MQKAVYILIVKGVYRHEIVGVLTEYTQAETIAREIVEGMRDNYHNIHIVSCPVNEQIEDGELVRVVSRADGEVKIRQPTKYEKDGRRSFY